MMQRLHSRGEAGGVPAGLTCLQCSPQASSLASVRCLWQLEQFRALCTPHSSQAQDSCSSKQLPGWERRQQRGKWAGPFRA